MRITGGLGVKYYSGKGACIFLTPFFTAVCIIEMLVLQTIYLLKVEILQFYSTARPRETRFLVLEKSSAAQNRTS